MKENNKKFKWLYAMLIPLLTLVLLVGVGSSVGMSVAHPTTVYAAEDDDKGETENESEKENDDKNKASETPIASGGDYSQLSIPSRIPTAYHNGYQKALSADDENEMKAFRANIENILGSSHTFGTVGTMFGSLGLSTASGTNNVAQVPRVSKEQIKSFLGPDGEAYWKFGRAYTNMVSSANTADASGLSAERVTEGLNGVGASVAQVGVKILRDFSPAPLVLALFDSSNLEANQNNKLVALVLNTPAAAEFFRLFGDTVPGTPNISISTMIVITVAMLSIALGLLNVFLNGRHFGETVRKTMVKIAVVSLAIPVGAKLYDFGLGAIDDLVAGTIATKSENIVKNNLDLASWAQYARFGLPQGVTLKINKDNKFEFTPEDVLQINIYSAEKAGLDTDIDSIAEHMIESGSTNKNRTTVNWSDAIRQSGEPYFTKRLNTVADKLGSNNEIDTDDIKKSGYLTDGSLTMSGSTVSGNGESGYGLPPTAAYNFMNTTFDTTGFNVNSNLQSPVIPTIAVGVRNYASTGEMAKDELPGLVKALVSLTMLIAGFSVLFKILSAGFGGMIHGGVASSLGSATGFGELVGGVLALLVGVFGLGIIMTLIQTIAGTLWEWMWEIFHTIFDGKDVSLGTGIIDKISSVPYVGGLLAPMFKGLSSVIMWLIAAIAFPKFVKIPIEAFGSWASSIPEMIAAKAAAMESRFTGDYRSGGTAGGKHMSQAAAKSAASTRSQSQALKNGALLAGGAMLKSIVGGTHKTKDGKDTNTKETDPKNPDTPTDDTENPEVKDNLSLTEAGATLEGATQEGNETNESKVDTQSQQDTTEGGDFSNESVAESSEFKDGDNQSETLDASQQEVTAESSSDFDSVSDSSISNENDLVDKSVGGATASGDNMPAEKSAAESSAVGDSTSAGETTSVDTPTNAQSDMPAGASESGATEMAAGVALGDNSQTINNGDLTNQQEGNTKLDSKSGDNKTQDLSKGGANQTVNKEGAHHETNASSDMTNMSMNSDEKASITADSIDRSNSANLGDKTLNQNNADAKSQSISNLDNSQNAGLKTEANALNASSQESVHNQNNQSNTSSSQNASKDGKTESREKSNRLTSAISKGFKTAVGTNKGNVSNKEQFAMGVAHMAAATVGAQGVTQTGVDNIKQRQNNAKNVKNDKKNDNQGKGNGTVAPKNGYTENDIQNMNRDNDGRRQRTQPTTTPANGQVTGGHARGRATQPADKPFFKQIERKSAQRKPVETKPVNTPTMNTPKGTPTGGTGTRHEIQQESFDAKRTESINND